MSVDYCGICGAHRERHGNYPHDFEPECATSCAEFVAAVRASALREAVEGMSDETLESLVRGAIWGEFNLSKYENIKAFRAALLRALSGGEP